MSEISPPYDFPPRQDSKGEQIEQLLAMFRMWLRLNPQWVPLLEKLLRYATR